MPDDVQQAALREERRLAEAGSPIAGAWHSYLVCAFAADESAKRSARIDFFAGASAVYAAVTRILNGDDEETACAQLAQIGMEIDRFYAGWTDSTSPQTSSAWQ